jgi:hypothetical protein
MMRVAALAIEPLSQAFAKLLPSQCNDFGFAITKAANPQPWIAHAITPLGSASGAITDGGDPVATSQQLMNEGSTAIK